MGLLNLGGRLSLTNGGQGSRLIGVSVFRGCTCTVSLDNVSVDPKSKTSHGSQVVSFRECSPVVVSIREQG